MTSYFVYDIPSQPLVIGVPAGFTEAEVRVDLVELEATVNGTTVTAQWPSISPFTVAGIHDVEVTLANADSLITLEAEPIVVQQRDGWHTLQSIRREWPAAATIKDEQLYKLLEVSKEQCLAWAPLTSGLVPFGHLHAQALQARNNWNAAKTDPATSGDGTEFVIRPYPLDNFVKNALRPKTAVPGMW
jgi:hypothetical protein